MSKDLCMSVICIGIYLMFYRSVRICYLYPDTAVCFIVYTSVRVCHLYPDTAVCFIVYRSVHV